MKDRAVSLNAVEEIVNKYIDGSFEWGAMLVQIKRLPSVTPQKLEREQAIKTLGEEMRITQKGITDEKVLLGFNMAVALCNKHIGRK